MCLCVLVSGLCVVCLVIDCGGGGGGESISVEALGLFIHVEPWVARILERELVKQNKEMNEIIEWLYWLVVIVKGAHKAHCAPVLEYEAVKGEADNFQG